MTENDPEWLRKSVAGGLFGEFIESKPSRQSVPVARFVFRSVDGAALRLSDGSESNAPHTSSSFGSVYRTIVKFMSE